MFHIHSARHAFHGNVPVVFQRLINDDAPCFHPAFSRGITAVTQLEDQRRGGNVPRTKAQKHVKVTPDQPRPTQVSGQKKKQTCAPFTLCHLKVNPEVREVGGSPALGRVREGGLGMREEGREGEGCREE